MKTLSKSKRFFWPERGNVVYFRGLQNQNFPYIFIWIVYYAWVVSFATWWTASPFTENVFGSELRSLMHSVNLISSAVFIFIIHKEWFVKTARIGALLVVAGMGLYILAPNASLQLLCAIAIGIALGCVNTSILMPFVFTLNNTEKLYAVVSSNVLISLISIFMESQASNSLPVQILLPVFILVMALSATLFFKPESMPQVDDSSIDIPEIQPRVYLTLLLNCIVAILCKGVGKGILNITAGSSELPIITLFYIGGLIGCLAYVAVYALAPKAFIWQTNITFGCLAMGLLCNAFSGQAPTLAVMFAVLLGIGSTVGMINMYYIIGVVGKKYNSMHYLQMSILFIGICGGVSGVVIGNVIDSINTIEVSMIASVVAMAFMLLFLMLSPLWAQSPYYDDWAKDSEKMEIDNEQLYRFKKYRLSKREIEVCKLLLQGYTLRQISGILSIAYSTVNTYCTSLYRKLEINSRTELLLLFKDYEIK